MKSFKLVELKFVGRLFLTSLLLLPISSGQPVADEASSENNEGAKVIYDQRQSGKYNIRINIKDVAIIEMDKNDLGDNASGEEDYYYDDDDLTVKPLKLTTPSHDASSTVFMHPISTPIQSYKEQMRIEERSASGATTTPITATKFINMAKSVFDSQATQPVSVHATKQIPTSHREILFKPTESLTSLGSLTLEPPHVPLPNLKSPMNVKFSSNKTATVTPSSILMAVIASPKPKQQESQKDLGDIGKQLSLHSGKSNYLTKYHVRRCRVNQYLNGAGNCRTIRSTSLLKKLLSVIATLPLTIEKERHLL